MVIKTGIIPRVAISLFGIDIYWYAVLITMAVILAILWCKGHSKKYNIKYEDILDLVIYLIPTALIFARLYYILFELDYFINNPAEILNIRNGGLAIYGGVIGGALTTIIFCKIKKLKFLDVLDCIAPALALGQAIGRWGNYINVEAYGYETSALIKMEILEGGMTKYVHPTFLYESIVTLGIFILLSQLGKKRKFSGEITYLYIIIYSFARIFIEGLRTDSLMLQNYRISQILSIVLFIIFSGIFIYAIYKDRKKDKK